MFSINVTNCLKTHNFGEFENLFTYLRLSRGNELDCHLGELFSDKENRTRNDLGIVNRQRTRQPMWADVDKEVNHSPAARRDQAKVVEPGIHHQHYFH